MKSEITINYRIDTDDSKEYCSETCPQFHNGHCLVFGHSIRFLPENDRYKRSEICINAESAFSEIAVYAGKKPANKP